MAKILEGKAVVAALNEKLKTEAAVLKQSGINPTLAIVRLGERGDDIAYERGAVKRCETIGVSTRLITLPENTSQLQLTALIEEINGDGSIHGCLLFRPLPKHIDENAVCNTLCADKDVDGISDKSLAGIFTGNNTGFPPCTAQACMEILDFYGLDLTGKKVTVIGRSLVVGKPAAMMALAKNATVKICHTRTSDMPAECREADILIVAAGRANTVNKNFLSPGQVVIDVGINMDESGGLCGDVAFEQATDIVSAITPVPGGVGTVTTSVLVKHVIESAKRMQGLKA